MVKVHGSVICRPRLIYYALISPAIPEFFLSAGHFKIPGMKFRRLLAACCTTSLSNSTSAATLYTILLSGPFLRIVYATSE
ncbi:hypothetical protein BDR07DRAFT_441273 [Suillus spraguei]|nr:hypothetical protein BDR07DRAFT_441273 [Suillus spraguei]